MVVCRSTLRSQASVDLSTLAQDCRSASDPETVSTGAMNLFKTLQVPETQRYWIRQARVPICFLPGGPKTAVDRDGATLIGLLVDNERIAAIEPAGVAASADLPAIDLEAHPSGRP